MISQLTLNGFKSFRKRTLNLSALTILTGLNNSGKSSIIQSLRMILNSIQGESPYLKGFGGYEELRSKDTKKQSTISISCRSLDGKFITLELSEDESSLRGDLKGINYEYITAARFGPSTMLPTMGEEISQVTVGSQGEFAVDYYLRFEDAIVDSRLHYGGRAGNTLKHQITHWMSDISPNIELEFEKLQKHDISILEINSFRPTNVGFGISYVLPILLAGLTMTAESVPSGFASQRDEQWFKRNKDKRAMLLVENPEAHLHPRGQTALGLFLAKVAACGIQVVVETHSDHFIDGVRLAAKSLDIVDPKDICFHFMELVSGESQVETIFVDENGKLDSWPEGFFDQTSINLRKLTRNIN